MTWGSLVPNAALAPELAPGIPPLRSGPAGNASVEDAASFRGGRVPSLSVSRTRESGKKRAREDRAPLVDPSSPRTDPRPVAEAPSAVSQRFELASTGACPPSASQLAITPRRLPSVTAPFASTRSWNSG